ncbi:MAG: hypothetical protein PHP79_00775, partial [Clostridia bacterium]|nr:hypothetical protein [Clostridia bacterium]
MSVRKKQLDRQRAEEEKLNEDIQAGLVLRVHYEERKKKNNLPNRVNIRGSIPEQKEDDQVTVENTTAVYRQMLPSLLNSLSRIEDPRAPHKVKHKITTLFIYGIIMFVFH